MPRPPFRLPCRVRRPQLFRRLLFHVMGNIFAFSLVNPKCDVIGNGMRPPFALPPFFQNFKSHHLGGWRRSRTSSCSGQCPPGQCPHYARRVTLRGGTSSPRVTPGTCPAGTKVRHYGAHFRTQTPTFVSRFCTASVEQNPCPGTAREAAPRADRRITSYNKDHLK
jgi:hypothetical protein